MALLAEGILFSSIGSLPEMLFSMRVEQLGQVVAVSETI